MSKTNNLRRTFASVTITNGLTIIVDKRVLLDLDLHDLDNLKETKKGETPYIEFFSKVDKEEYGLPETNMRHSWYKCHIHGCYHLAQSLRNIKKHVASKHRGLLDKAQYEDFRDKSLDRVKCKRCKSKFTVRNFKDHQCRPPK